MRAPMEVIDGALVTVEPEYRQIISSHGWRMIPRSQLLAAKRQIMKTDYAMKLAISNPQSFQDAVTTAGILGVDLTEGKRQGWLVPRDGRIAFQIGYKGIEAIHQRLGVISRLVVRTVHENDQFSWSGDDQEKPDHNAGDWFNESARGEVVGAYSITYFPDGTLQVMSESVEAIYRDHRDKSDSWKNEKARRYSPWMNHPKAMIEKTMAQIAAKQWPAATHEPEKASEVLERLHQTETDDYSVYKGTDALIVNELHAFMLASDALGVYLLHKQAKDEEEIMAWHWWPATPKGLKGACRDNCEALKSAGQELYSCILNAIDAEEAFRLAECIDSATAETKRMLAADIGEAKTATIKALLKQVAG